ncbi:efflux RND transporter periplasmic adaptor subunit [Motilimonas pumila]|uniref:efflux RND transporter periplasmic adaptor subunit n=1 Tax=Motilimonas pumila TaxID=2303987 RepID=UPI001313E8E5|nr:efflux RND transporter periplasmic adaptor subunit [Motilimonas pumila]
MATLNPFRAFAPKRALLAGSVALSLLLTGCSDTSQPDTAAKVVRPVSSEIVSNHDQQQLHFSGTVSASTRAELSFQSSGRIVELMAKEGSQVSQGDVLARLDAANAQIGLALARTELENAKVEYQRANTLFNGQHGISKSQLDEITLRYHMAQNKLKEAQKKLDDTYLIAPFDGVISRQSANNYTVIQANETIFTLHDLSQMEVVIDVPEAVMVSTTPKANIFATSPLFPKHTFALHVSEYQTEPDPMTRTYQVTLGLETQSGAQLLPGMHVQVVSQWQPETSHVSVPLTAISPDNLGHQYVWVIDNQSRLNKRQIETGSLQGNRVQVLASLQAGEHIVTSGTQRLSQGLQVRPLYQ